VEMRGKSLSGHARRVADHARVLARMIGLEEAEQQNVLFAALLHDIGKIGLSDEVLDRPMSTLSADMRADLMRHPERGELALMQIEQLKGAALLIRHHHELYDGSGYPDHLAGLAIPMGARIIAVPNEYDGLINGTLTQLPLRPKDALAYLIEYRGKRYDPMVVDHFTEILSDQIRHVIDEIPIRPSGLKPGMVLARDLMHQEGYMLLAKGYVIDQAVIGQLVKIHQGMTIYVCREGVNP